MQPILASLVFVMTGLWYSATQTFFWVPNRYTAPFWSGDTHITNHFIDSWDIYLGSSHDHTKANHYDRVDFILSWYQTVAAGFFCEATMPMSSISVRDPDSPLKALGNGLCYENCTILAGWGTNYDALPFFDFIDYMLRIGIATPAHVPALQEARLETLYGYPTWGIPIASNLALGICSWMTFGLHISLCQFHANPLVWHIQPYFKADHFLAGFSGWFGYSYTGARHDSDSKILFLNQKNLWHMHTLHYGLEYECIQSYFPIHPRIGFYYNQCVGGEHTLERSNFGGTLGLDITW